MVVIFAASNAETMLPCLCLFGAQAGAHCEIAIRPCGLWRGMHSGQGLHVFIYIFLPVTFWIKMAGIACFLQHHLPSEYYISEISEACFGEILLIFIPPKCLQPQVSLFDASEEDFFPASVSPWVLPPPHFFPPFLVLMGGYIQDAHRNIACKIKASPDGNGTAAVCNFWNFFIEVTKYVVLKMCQCAKLYFYVSNAAYLLHHCSCDYHCLIV